MANLLNLVQKIEKDWYRDFRAFPFEDTDVLIYNDDTEEFDTVDVDELKKECSVLVNEYLPSMIAETEESEDLDEEEKEDIIYLYKSWIDTLDHIVKDL